MVFPAATNNQIVPYLQAYQQALNTLEKQFNRLQQQYAEHIKCGLGCSQCCETGNFRIRFVEALYLLSGFSEASPKTAAAILNNLKRHQSGDKRCPILIEGQCGLYQNRPTLCRGYGVILYLNQEFATCPLNFMAVENQAGLDAIDLAPYYEVVETCSEALWKIIQPTEAYPGMLSIQAWLEKLLNHITVQATAPETDEIPILSA